MKVEIKDLEGRSIRAIDLDDGEYRLCITHTKQIISRLEQESAALALRHWAMPIGLTAFVLLFSAFHHLYLNTYERSVWDLFKYAINIGSFLVFVAVITSILSKAVSGKFQPPRSVNLALLGFVFYYLYDTDLLGLRWAMPKLFWYAQGYDILFYLWVGIASWYMGGFLLPCLRVPTRALVFGIIAIFFISYKLVNYLPVSEKYSYFDLNMSPPRVEFLESKPITVDELLSRIDSEN